MYLLEFGNNQTVICRSTQTQNTTIIIKNNNKKFNFKIKYFK